MPIFKCDWFFEAGSSGWSETLYVTSDFPPPTDNYQQVYAKMKALAIRRSALLAQPAYIKALRVSDVSITKDSLLGPGEGWDTFDATYFSDTPWQALLIRLGNTGRYWRPLYMRGIPDFLFESFKLNKLTSPAQAWFLAFNAWRAAVTDLSFQIRVAAKEQATAPEYRVAAYSLVANNLSVTTVDNNLIDVGDTVVFYQRGFSPPLGRRVVTAAPALDRFEVTYKGTRDDTATPGRVKKIVVQYVTIDTINYERIVHRDTGRPFGLQRGRRGKRVC